MEKLLKPFILIALGMFLYTRITDGTILFYIHRRFVILTLLSAVAMLVVAASYYYQPAHNHNHNHEHEHEHNASWWGLLIVVLPIVTGLIVPPQPLGAAAMGNREVNLGDGNALLLSVTGNGSAQFPANRTDRLQWQVPPMHSENEEPKGGMDNPLDWMDVLPKMFSPDALEGQSVQLTGFIYRDDRFPDDSFVVGRFIVSCCVADASALGIVVQWPKANMVPIDQWVTVNGRFQTDEFLGQTLPILVADLVEPTDIPDLPYFYR